jgi:hypothetical protein
MKVFNFKIASAGAGVLCAFGTGIFAQQKDNHAVTEKYVPLALHESVRDEGGECLLVCEFEVKANSHGIKVLADKGEMELHVKATVIEVYGDQSRRRGDRIDYIQYWGSAAESEKESKERTGDLAFIFRQKTPSGELFFDPQDPSSRVKYSKEAEKGIVKMFGKELLK